jgi:protein-S-isoprenylcysteine O-methyltransferase Ste14
MANEVAHKRWWQIFEVVFGLPFLAAIALHYAMPLRLPRTSFAPAIVAAGIALIIAGVALVVLARREFARRGQPTDPGQPTSALITSGVFAVSRNPLYLGGVAVLLGIALAFRMPWALVLLVPALVACHVVLIAPEERYLAAMFGEEYRAYAASVRRWIGRSRPGR